MYGPADDARQDRRLAALEQSIKDLWASLEADGKAIRELHVRIDRLPTPTITEPPVTGFWSFMAHLFG